MIANIIDCRATNAAYLRVWGVVEPTAHDNTVKGADKAPRPSAEACAITADHTGPMTLAQVLSWAQALVAPVELEADLFTLYLYDFDPMNRAGK